MKPTTVPIGADNKPKFNPQNFNNWRRLDLEYAIEWNRLKGKDIPEAKTNVAKDKLVSFCDYHDVDMSLCETYVDMHGALRIKRPPRKEAKQETNKDLEGMKMQELRSLAKEKGVNSFGKSKDVLIKELAA